MATDTLNKVKLALRISHDKLDDDIQANIDACVMDLQVSGVIYADETNPLIQNAVKLYCKAAYTDDPVKAARYQGGYDALKGCLMYAEGYGWEEASGDE